MHGLLSQHLDDLVSTTRRRLVLHANVVAQASEKGDPLRVIIQELGGVPHLGSDELRDARDTVVTLELTNRFAHVKGTRECG
jgi:Ras GTPase-activating-like protein IQGAP2/3